MFLSKSSLVSMVLFVASPVSGEEITCPFLGVGMAPFTNPEGFQMYDHSGAPVDMSVLYTPASEATLVCRYGTGVTTSIKLTGLCSIVADGGQITIRGVETLCQYQEGQSDDCVAVCG